jgi:hypothetical protein
MAKQQRDQFYTSTITVGVQGNTVVLMDADENGQDKRVLVRLTPEAARKLGSEITLGAEQCCDT